MAKKKIPTPLYDIVTGEPLDPAKDQQAFTVVAKEETNKLSLDEAMQRDYGDLMREPSLLGVQMSILKELVRMRLEK